MKPIKIEMIGFESYCEKTCIDFEKLGKNSIYLITGDTGSGKTTIFDAITFALYGKPCGQDRTEEMLRSDFADKTVPTEVILEFESNGKRYLIKRNPSYFRQNKKGSGTTEEKPNATLTFLTDNIPPVEGSKKVSEKIEEILKLNKDQFCKIAMIPQGAFQKMLTANTLEKMKIFRELFDTKKFENLVLALKEEERDASEALEKEKINLHHYLSLISVNEDKEEFERIEEIKKLNIVNDDDIAFLEQFLGGNAKNLEKTLQQIEKIENEILENDKKITTENLRQNYLSQKSKLESDFEKKSKEQEILIEKLSLAEQKAKEKDLFIQKKTRLEDSFKIYDEISDTKNALLKFQDERKKLSEQKEKNTILQKEKQDELLKKSEELNSLKDVVYEKMRLTTQIDNLQNKISNLDTIKEKTKLYFGEKAKYEKAVSAYKEAEKFSLEAEEKYSINRKLYNAEKAGILAETLQEGMPCPVCGSKTHPQKAQKAQNAPSEETLNEFEKKFNEAKDMATSRSEEANIIKTKIEILESEVLERIEKFTKDFSDSKELLQDNENFKNNDFAQKIENEILKLKKDLENTKKQLAQEEEKIEKKQNLENEIPQINIQIENILQKNQEIEKQIIVLDSKIENSKNTIDEKAKSLEFENYDQAKKEFDFIQMQISELDKNLSDARDNKNKCENEIAELNGGIKKIETQLKDLPAEDITKLNAIKADKKEKKENLNRIRDELNKQDGKNREAISEIKKLSPKIPFLEQRFEMISTLCKIASGKSVDKISLETYVQMRYLDEITRHANSRLKVMTDKKYELVRRTEKTGNAQSGLDFNIKDFYTGRERTVSSLSGGEQFQASLALALGLADEIQKSSGGIKLDTMFIDEGFGTLDSDTLNKSMKALEDLSKTNKQIGIISHVSELEERIPNKIKVTKDKITGKSSAEIVIDM